MVITSSNTHWIFICAILSEDPDDGNPYRHVIDVTVGLNTLINILNVPKENVSFLLDTQVVSLKQHEKLLNYVDKVHGVDDFSSVIHSNNLPNLIVLVYGHGSIHGLDAYTNITPFHFVNTLQSRQNLEAGIVVFGQCFSGIYNFVDLRANNSETSNAQLCFLGASNLNSSISSTSIREEGEVQKLTWTANLFMLFFFDWLYRKGIDIDGDTKYTLMDAYKYAGGKASENLLLAKEPCTAELYRAQKRLDEIEQEYLNKPTNQEDLASFEAKYEIDKKTIQKIIKNNTNIKHTIQDPWFLNANKAREIEFQL